MQLIDETYSVISFSFPFFLEVVRFTSSTGRSLYSPSIVLNVATFLVENKDIFLEEIIIEFPRRM